MKYSIKVIYYHQGTRGSVFAAAFENNRYLYGRDSGCLNGVQRKRVMSEISSFVEERMLSINELANTPLVLGTHISELISDLDIFIRGVESREKFEQERTKLMRNTQQEIVTSHDRQLKLELIALSQP